MKEVRECPICDWKHEAEPPKVPPEALASVFGPGVMSMVAMQQHAQDIERALAAFIDHTLKRLSDNEGAQRNE